VNTRIYTRVAEVVALLPHDGEARMQVGQSSGRQRRAAGQELNEQLALVRVHVAHDAGKQLEAGT